MTWRAIFAGPYQQVVAGGLLAVGLINVNVRNDCDPAYGLLYESVNKENPSVRIGAIMGLGLAYAGCQKEEVQVRPGRQSLARHGHAFRTLVCITRRHMTRRTMPARPMPVTSSTHTLNPRFLNQRHPMTWRATAAGPMPFTSLIHTLHPRFLSPTASDDVASTIWLALGAGAAGARGDGRVHPAGRRGLRRALPGSGVRGHVPRGVRAGHRAGGDE